MEIWKKIKGTDGQYEVSSEGKVRSRNYLGHGRTQELALAKDQKGYYRIRIYQNEERRTCKVHRLVAEAFIPNPENRPEVNHINGNKTDNRAENLEWVTAHENARHAYKAGLKEKTREHCRQMGATIGRKNLAMYREKRKTPVIATRISDGAEFEYSSQAEAEEKTGASQPNIHKVLNGARKSTHGFTFRYKEVVK